MSFFSFKTNLMRSERMGQYKLVMSKESAWDIMSVLGEKDSLHFIDSSDISTQIGRPFTTYVKRCDEMLNKIQLLQERIKQFKLKIQKCNNTKKFIENINLHLQQRQKAEHTYFEDIEKEVSEKLERVDFLIKNYEKIEQDKERLYAFKAVIKCAFEMLGKSLFQQGQPRKKSSFYQQQPQFNLYSQQVENVQQQKFNYIDVSAQQQPQQKQQQQEIQFAKKQDDQEIQLDKNQQQEFEFESYDYQGIGVKYICGVINSSEAQIFLKIIFRASKGYVLTDLKEIDPEDENEIIKDKNNDQIIRKSVFVLLFIGGEYNMLQGKIKKICTSFNVMQFQIPRNGVQFNQQMAQVIQQLQETKNVLFFIQNTIRFQQLLNMSQEQIINQLEQLTNYRTKDLSNCSLIEELRLFAIKEKYIYIHLNMLQFENNIFKGNLWMPLSQEHETLAALNELKIKKSHIAGQIQKMQEKFQTDPPSYIKTNAFTSTFQVFLYLLIVNTYGIPRYREINPGLFTIVTFPFLFGVMFGDILHGLLIVIAATLMCLFNNKLSQNASPTIKSVLSTRYLFLLMGIFSFYCGWLYNDFTSISFNAFGSCYDPYSIDPMTNTTSVNKNCVYHLGLDPVWMSSSNYINFINSLKMKLSVVFGVIQMIFGIILKGINTIYFQKKLDFYFEFIPQLLFMAFLFGYMDIMIVIKWLTNYQIYQSDPTTSNCAPNLIQQLLDLVLGIGKVSDCNQNPSDANSVSQPFNLYGKGSLQKGIQQIIVLICVLSVPLMMLPKPLIISCCKRKKQSSQINDNNSPKKQNNLEFKQNKDALFDEFEQNGKQKLLMSDDSSHIVYQEQKQNFSPDNDQEKLINLDDHQNEENFFQNLTHSDIVRNQAQVEGIEQSTEFLSQIKHDEDDGVWIHSLIETIEFVLGLIFLIIVFQNYTHRVNFQYSFIFKAVGIIISSQ